LTNGAPHLAARTQTLTRLEEEVGDAAEDPGRLISQ
jgi:hypothetical protein